MTLLVIGSIIGLFRFVFIAIIFFLLVRWITSLFSEQHPKEKFAQGDNLNNENKTTITNVHPKSKTAPAYKGEYVDFEEIK